MHKYFLKTRYVKDCEKIVEQYESFMNIYTIKIEIKK